jgi:hypothetical protein
MAEVIRMAEVIHMAEVIRMAEVIHMAEDVVEGEDGIGAGVDMDTETIRVTTTKEAIREIITGTIRETIKVLVMNIELLMVMAFIFSYLSLSADHNLEFTLSPIDNGGYSNQGRGGGRGRNWGYRGKLLLLQNTHANRSC